MYHYTDKIDLITHSKMRGHIMCVLKCSPSPSKFRQTHPISHISNNIGNIFFEYKFFEYKFFEFESNSSHIPKHQNT